VEQEWLDQANQSIKEQKERINKVEEKQSTIEELARSIKKEFKNMKIYGGLFITLATAGLGLYQHTISNNYNTKLESAKTEIISELKDYVREYVGEEATKIGSRFESTEARISGVENRIGILELQNYNTQDLITTYVINKEKDKKEK